MASSAAELRGKVHAVNQDTEAAQATLRLATEQLEQLGARYSNITNQPELAAAVQYTTQASERAQEALQLAGMAIDQANAYTLRI